MEAVRKIMNADALASLIDLPWKGKDMKVEIIVMPAPETAWQRAVDEGAMTVDEFVDEMKSRIERWPDHA
jgi:hypothetical protein